MSNHNRFFQKVFGKSLLAIFPKIQILIENPDFYSVLRIWKLIFKSQRISDDKKWQ